MFRILAIVLLAYVFLYPRFANTGPISVIDTRSEQLQRIGGFDPLSDAVAALTRSVKSLSPLDDVARKLREGIDG
jgi:hypothetical protein